MTRSAVEGLLEWEWAAQDIVLEYLDFPSPPFVGGTQKVTVRRDDDMVLRLTATGSLQRVGQLAEMKKTESQRPAGTIAESQSCEFASILLHGTFDPMPDVSISGDGRSTFTSRAAPHLLRRASTAKFGIDEDGLATPDPVGVPTWRSDWFINGPQSRIALRITNRRHRGRLQRIREHQAVDMAYPVGGGGARDHIVVETPALCFTVSQVPAGFAPPWSRPTSIDFFDPVPPPEVREAVAEIVSFVSGRRLMRLGSTLFDPQGWPSEEEVVNPWGLGIRRVCENGSTPPVPIQAFSEDIERILAELAPRYIAKRAMLTDALMTYWAANETYSGVELTLYASAVEALKNEWFKADPSGTKDAYLPEAKFKETFASVIEAFKRTVESEGLPEAMVNKMNGLFRMGGNEQLEMFLAELGVPIGRVERKAIRARNGPAHGGLKSGADQTNLAKLGNAYRVLFERCFLKILGFNGCYIDRTTLSYPARPISEPAGGIS